MKNIITLLIILTPFLIKAQCTGDILISQGAAWKYKDDGSDQGVVWKDTGFDDSTWASGNAELGYGDGDEATEVDGGTVIVDRYITTYFRHSFNISDVSLYPNGLTLSLLRDDGAVIYVNGTEVIRDNMTSGSFDFETTASSNVTGSDESTFFNHTIPTSVLVNGNNLIAVEIHQSGFSSSDVSFDLQVCGAPVPTIVRGPYLQSGSDNQMIVKWRTSAPTNSVVNFGDSPSNLNQSEVNINNFTTEHEILISGLQANTTYYYNVGDDSNVLAGGDNNHYFKTAPTIGTDAPYRFWVLGDCGTKDNNQRGVRDAFYGWNNGEHLDGILLLGDNAYDDGTDSEYQAAIFENMYEDELINSITWSCPGNHDIRSADSGNNTGPYYDIFSFPKQGECGGLASGTEAYYSFDYGNIHFVSLDSDDSDRSANGTMLTWLENDLANTNADWIIALWHHPPYTKGSHDSDNLLFIDFQLVDMRENALPILESYGVDLVLNGHSHSYERSYLINGHYGFSWDFEAATHAVDGDSGKEDIDGAYEKQHTGSNEGTVYIVAGSSGKTSGGLLNHPAMYTSQDLLGSVAVDVNNNRMDVKFIDGVGGVADYFTIVKNDLVPVQDLTATEGTYQLTNMFPVPCDEELNVSLIAKKSTIGFIEIFDVEGKRLSVQSIQTQVGNNIYTVDTNALPSGNYVMQVVIDNIQLTDNFVKK